MTRDDIIRIAREAGGVDIASNGWTSWVGTQSTEFLERFAALVAADEREFCAKVCEWTAGAWTEHDYNSGCADCAAAIRNGGKQ